MYIDGESLINYPCELMHKGLNMPSLVFIMIIVMWVLNLLKNWILIMLWFF